jgi:hypothetical protein
LLAEAWFLIVISFFFSGRAVNKVQWIATYTILHDPATGLVTRTTLKELYDDKNAAFA